MMKLEQAVLGMSFMILLIVVLAFGLAGCTTRPLQVTAPCPKSVIPAPPVDYMAQLKPGDTPAAYVRACTLTRLSAIDAYNECAHVCGGYE